MIDPFPQRRRNRFGAVLFDLDGTLVETAPDLCNALNHALAKLGCAPVSMDTMRNIVGDGARKMLERGFAEQGRSPTEAALDQGFTLLLEHYWQHIADQSHPFPGLVTQLQYLRESGCQLAVCTNKPFAHSEKLLKALDLADYFACIAGGDSFAVRKPDPGHLLETLKCLNIPPQKAVMIGDSMPDVAAARAANMPVILVSFGYSKIPAADLGADAVIDHFDALADALGAVS